MIYKKCTKCGRQLNYRNKLKGRNGCKMCARKYEKERVIEKINKNIEDFINSRNDVKKINDFDRYFISNDGRVYSVNAGGVKELVKSQDRDGYEYVTLYKVQGRRKTKKLWKIHQLVAIHFIPNKHPRIKKIINHIDGVKNNNHYTNLEWCTYKHNTQHALKHGLIKKGSEVKSSKLTEKQVLEIFQSKKKKSYKKLAEEYGVSLKLITLIMHNKVWKHVKRVKPKRRLLCNRVKKENKSNEI